MADHLIRDRLVERGRVLFMSPRQPARFTGVPEADALLNDLDHHPHAFVLACVMDRQIRAEKAWLIPYRISERLGGFAIETLASLSPSRVTDLLTRPAPLHRFISTMSGYFHAAVQRIHQEYGGDASLIWSGEPSSAEVVYRFLQFEGVGPKIATMAANTLVRDFKIPFADYFSIDISADVHVRRVFARLGLAAPAASPEQVIFRARALHPEFPGLMDFPCWEIGRSWCKAQEPLCTECYMKDLCPTPRAGGKMRPQLEPPAWP